MHYQDEELAYIRLDTARINLLEAANGASTFEQLNQTLHVHVTTRHGRGAPTHMLLYVLILI